MQCLLCTALNTKSCTGKFVSSIKLCNKTKTKQNKSTNLKKLGYVRASATGYFDPTFPDPYVK